MSTFVTRDSTEGRTPSWDTANLITITTYCSLSTSGVIPELQPRSTL